MQGAGEVVAAATGDDQNRQLQLHQLWKISMNRSISAEDENRIGFVGIQGTPD